jgi:hypothetical protein
MLKRQQEEIVLRYKGHLSVLDNAVVEQKFIRVSFDVTPLSFAEKVLIALELDNATTMIAEGEMSFGSKDITMNDIGRMLIVIGEAVCRTVLRSRMK